MKTRSRFAHTRGLLLAADVSDERGLRRLLEDVGDYIDALKLGNSILYVEGLGLIERLKRDYRLPIIADLKLTDVAHIAGVVVERFKDAGADVVVLAGVCGEHVIHDAVIKASPSCEVWAFTEFTHDSGLIDPKLADQSTSVAQRAGALGLQVPGTRPHRIEDARETVGEDLALMACGIGAQGASYGSAVRAGANLEIVGRGIYAAPHPKEAAREASRLIKQL